MTTARDFRQALSAALMVASGFAGLGYQIVWTQQASSWLGHESAAVLAVVAAFFGGLALGGLLLGSRIERSRYPRRWYVLGELAIAAWGLVLLTAGPHYSVWVQAAIGAEPGAGWQWLVAFTSTLLLLLPATAAMGATLPAMERLTAPLERHGRTISVLYASNTFGAVLGVVLTAFWLLPSWGLSRSAAVCVALNMLCAAGAQLAFSKTAERLPSTARSAEATGLLVRLAATGFLGIAYEVLVVRALSQVTENTVYTFALVLAMYLLGTAAGAAAYRRWLQGRVDAEAWDDRLLAALAGACVLGAGSLWAAEAARSWLVDAFGASFAAALSAEATLPLLAFGAPTLVMGALFSHLCRRAAASGVSFGLAFGVNTCAAAFAPAAAALLLAPVLGLKLALLSVAASYLALTARSSWTTRIALLPAAAAVALAVLAPPLRFVEMPEQGRLLEYREGALGAVSVVEDAEGVARLRINNRQQEGSSATEHVDARQAWLPLLLHPAPRQVLFLGLGTGVTASSAAEDPTLQVAAVELLPEVIAVSRHFVSAPRLRVYPADARRFVRASPNSYDLIISDNFHPARSGSASLYTVEHFGAVRDRLAANGLFCQWLPLHQLDIGSLRSVARSFTSVFPDAWAVLASNSLDTPVVGLMAGPSAARLDVARVRARLAQVALPQRVRSLGLEDELAVLGSIVAGPSALRRFGAGAALNTDDHPVVAYSAPRLAYAPESRPRDRLVAVLRELSSEPGELLAPTPDSSFQARLAAYWLARTHYIAAGRDVRPSARVEDMLAQVREPLLAVLRTSPDFRPAYDPLLGMAQALARSNASDARSLLSELVRLQPARPEASQTLTLLSRTSNTEP